MSSRSLSLTLLLIAMSSIQSGASLAKDLFPVLGAGGTTVLRTSLAAVFLILIWRPWRMHLSRKHLGDLVAYGTALGIMNLCFYLSLQRIPLGIAVALEFTGPLGVALYASRRPLDLAWLGFAALGLVLLLPLSSQSLALDPIGVAYALAAGFCWALYIIFGKRIGSAIPSGQAASLGMVIAACVVFPLGSGGADWSALSPPVFLQALLIALLSSALPYTLEMFALKQLPTKTFGILMSFEPALAALIGFTFLAERLHPQQWTAICCIMLASAGSVATAPAGRPPASAAETPLP